MQAKSNLIVARTMAIFNFESRFGPVVDRGLLACRSSLCQVIGSSTLWGPVLVGFMASGGAS